jgi:hypothetical protein
VNYAYSGQERRGGSAHTPVEAPDDLLSTAKLKMLLAIAEGEIQGELTAQQIFSMIQRWLTLTAVTISPVLSGTGDAERRIRRTFRDAGN